MRKRFCVLLSLWMTLSISLLGRNASAQERFSSSFLVEAGSKTVLRAAVDSKKPTVEAIWGKVEVVEGFILYTAPAFFPPEGKDVLVVYDDKGKGHREEVTIQNAKKYLVRADPLAAARGMDPDGDGYYEVAINSEEELQHYNDFLSERGERVLDTTPSAPEYLSQELIQGGESLKLPDAVRKWSNDSEDYFDTYGFNDGEEHFLRQVGKQNKKHIGAKPPFFPRPATCDSTQTIWEVAMHGHPP